MVILLSLAFTCCVESMQYVRRLGLCEIDDIIDNTLGGALGLVGYWIFRWLTEKLKPGSRAFRHGCTLVCIAVFLGFSGYISAQYIATGSKVLEKEFAFHAEAKDEGDRLVLEGYTFPYHREVSTDYILRLAVCNTVNYLVCETETGLPTPEVDEYYGGNGAWANCGFRATIEKAKLQPGTAYELSVKYKGRFNTNTVVFLQDGVLGDVQPWMIQEPDLRGTDLEFLQEEGSLLICERPAYMTVYRIGRTLYLVAGEDYDFAENGRTLTELRCWTTRPELLPAESYEADWDCDNRSVYFEDAEITGELNCGPWRVARIELPNEYPISVLHVGYYYDRNWQWARYYRPGMPPKADAANGELA